MVSFLPIYLITRQNDPAAADVWIGACVSRRRRGTKISLRGGAFRATTPLRTQDEIYGNMPAFSGPTEAELALKRTSREPTCSGTGPKI